MSMHHRLLPALLTVAGTMLMTVVHATPSSAAPARSGVLLVSGSGATHAVDPRTGRVLREVGAGADTAVSRRGGLAYARDVDPCHPDIEGCWGARDLLVSSIDGRRERVLVHNPEQQGGVSAPDFSPDGRRLIYYWGTPGERGINIINTDGTGNASLVRRAGAGRFSPDGRSVAFVRDGDVQVIDVAGGEIRAVTTGGTVTAGSVAWSPDGHRLVYAAEDTFRIVPAAGGVPVSTDWWPVMLHQVDAPVFSPDGREVAFTAYESFSDPDAPWVRRLFVAAADGSAIRAVGDSGDQATAWLGR